MAYTDDTVYCIRECEELYSELAKELRSQKEVAENLDALLIENNLSYPSQELKKAETLPENQEELFTEKVKQCIDGYFSVRRELSEVTAANTEKQAYLREKGISCDEMRTVV